MIMIETLGWIATVITLVSFTMNDMVKLRLIGGVSAILWSVYGVLKMDNPLIVINLMIIVIHSYWFYKNCEGAGAGGKVEKGNFIDSSQNSLEGSRNSLEGSQTSSEDNHIRIDSPIMVERSRLNKANGRKRGDNDKVHGIRINHIDFMWNWIREKSGK